MTDEAEIVSVTRLADHIHHHLFVAGTLLLVDGVLLLVAGALLLDARVLLLVADALPLVAGDLLPGVLLKLYVVTRAEYQTSVFTMRSPPS